MVCEWNLAISMYIHISMKLDTSVASCWVTWTSVSSFLECKLSRFTAPSRSNKFYLHILHFFFFFWIKCKSQMAFTLSCGGIFAFRLIIAWILMFHTENAGAIKLSTMVMTTMTMATPRTMDKTTTERKCIYRRKKKKKCFQTNSLLHFTREQNRFLSFFFRSFACCVRSTMYTSWNISTRTLWMRKDIIKNLHTFLSKIFCFLFFYFS